MTKIALPSIVLCVALLAPGVAVAQTGPGAGCPGSARMQRGRGGPALYDAKTVTTVQGEVADVQRIERRRHAGVHIIVATGTETIAVHLGPDFYVDLQELKLAKGDRVEVKGSRITFDGKPAMIAQEVRRGGQVLALRDVNGLPLWRGEGRGR